MQKIAIYGAGGFGRETKLLIDQINEQSEKWEFIGFFDDNVNSSSLGGKKALNELKEELFLVVAIADSNVRKDIVESINNEHIKYPILIHPTVVYDSKELTVGEGSIITAMNVFTTNIRLGKHSIINLTCTIGHDNIIDDYSSIMPGVHLSGNVKVGEGVLIGTGARVLQNLNIGDWSKIGAGAVVIDDVKEKTTVVGVPAKVARQ